MINVVASTHVETISLPAVEHIGNGGAQGHSAVIIVPENRHVARPFAEREETRAVCLQDARH